MSRGVPYPLLLILYIRYIAPYRAHSSFALFINFLMKVHSFNEHQLALSDYQEAEYQAMLEGTTYYVDQLSNEIIESYLSDSYLPATY